MALGAAARVRHGATCRSATVPTRPYKLQPMAPGWGCGTGLMDEITNARVQMIDSSIVRVHEHAAGTKKGVEIVAWAVVEAD